MYRLIKENVERAVDREAARDRLLAEGYRLIKEKKAAKPKEGGGDNGESGADKDA
jgi:hypothetical protein